MRVKHPARVGKGKLEKSLRKTGEARKIKIDVLIVVPLTLHGLNWECDLKPSTSPGSTKKNQKNKKTL